MHPADEYLDDWDWLALFCGVSSPLIC